MRGSGESRSTCSCQEGCDDSAEGKKKPLLLRTDVLLLKEGKKKDLSWLAK